jgi:hypothetical protein
LTSDAITARTAPSVLASKRIDWLSRQGPEHHPIAEIDNNNLIGIPSCPGLGGDRYLGRDFHHVVGGHAGFLCIV